MDPTQNRFNPLAFLSRDPEAASELTKRLIAMLPPVPERSPAEQAALDQKHAENRARYEAARYGELPLGTYRLLEQGSFIGWYYELEIDGEAVVLKHPGVPERGAAFALHRHPELVDSVAREEIARRHGAEAAASAKFRVMFGGQL
jgi:hypothetical protein